MLLSKIVNRPNMYPFMMVLISYERMGFRGLEFLYFDNLYLK